MSEPVLAVDAILSCNSTSRPQIELEWSPLRRKFFERKYWIDRLFGIVLLVLFLPAIALLWTLVKLTSRGPGFYRQTRLGLNRKEYKLIKLRSMVVDSEVRNQAFWAVGNDKRITPLGKILRDLHLDELPQLFNVARGEMALVGPRPERPSICELLRKRIDDYYDRVLIKPGITGLSQINLESDSSLEDVVRKQTLDLQYINESNYWLEFRILVATALRMLGIKGEATMKMMRLCRRSSLEQPKTETVDKPYLNWHVFSQPLQGTHVRNSDVATPSRTNVDSPDSMRRVVFPYVGDQIAPIPNTPISDAQRNHGAAVSTQGRISTATGRLNCLTVDVEDYFQVSAFARRVSRRDWDRYTCRVEANTNRLLSMFDSCQMQGTFFVLGWIAERYPNLIRRIANAGHEIASHGYWHQLVYDLIPEEFEKDIVASREAIFNACGVEVTMYRAPSFSIVPRSRWALEILAANGFKVDSSIFPISGHDRYGDPDAPLSIHAIETAHGKIVEFPPTSGRVGKIPIPIGGGYFRLLPLSLTQRAIDQVNKSVGPAMLYIHPWEIDPNQPRIDGVSKKSRFRHYVGLRNTETKLRQLLKTRRFTTVSNVIESQSIDKNSIELPASEPMPFSRIVNPNLESEFYSV